MSLNVEMNQQFSNFSEHWDCQDSEARIKMEVFESNDRLPL